MSPVVFLGGWALRSALVAAATAALLAILRVRSASVRLAAWTAALFASLLIPVLAPIAPTVVVPGTAWMHARQPETGSSEVVQSHPTAAAADRLVVGAPVAKAPPSEAPRPHPAGTWQRALIAVYVLGASFFLARIVIGVALTRRIMLRSTETDLSADGVRVVESRDLAAPAALGLRRAVIALPTGWKRWDVATLNAVLAHERSHVDRHDPAVQSLSSLHRAVLWLSPVSWWMHGTIVRLAEQVSDDAALLVAPDRTSYAEVLLRFMRRGKRPIHWEGVAMARFESVQRRIDHILDGPGAAQSVTRLGIAAIVAIAIPALVLAAAVAPAPPEPPPAPLPGSSSDADRPVVINRYLVVDGDSMSGSWDASDEPPMRAWRSKYGSHFAWFRRQGRDYIVTDTKTLDEIREAMAPQRDVNARQSEVNRAQTEVNSHQSVVNTQQAAVNRVQSDVNARQAEVSRLDKQGKDSSASQSHVNGLQLEVNRQQDVVNEVQAKVNAEQSVVNGRQETVNRIQARVSEEIQSALDGIFDEALRTGTAHIVE